MMLHERSLKSILIERIKNYTTEYTSILGNNYLYFDQSTDKYIGVKLHHGHPFLIDKNHSITYPRGIHSRIVMDVYMSLKDRKVFTKNEIEGLTYKARPKKKEYS